MRWLRRLSVVAAFALLFVPVLARADVNDFTIDSFDASYRLSNEDKQGRLKVHESINVTFSDNNHGLLRAIPNTYKEGSVDLKVNYVSSSTGAPSQYTTYEENNNTVLKIGDPNKTVTGAQQYSPDYELNNVIGFYEDHDEFYWDINGDQWGQPADVVSVGLVLDDGLKVKDDMLECFTGGYGSNEDFCSISLDGNVVRARTTAPLQPYETLTIVVGFEKGYFSPVTFSEKLRDNARTILGVMVPPLLIGGFAFRRWLRYGRDAKGRGTIVPEYAAPDGLTPAEVGAVADFRVDQRDITATIIDLAVRGYIRIIEEKQVKRLRRDTLEYSVELVRADTAGLKDFEREILTGLFKDGPAGTVVEFKSLRNKLYAHIAKAQKQAVNGLVKAEYFKANPATAGARLWVVLVLLFVLVTVFGSLLGPAIIVGLVLAIIPVFIFAIAMPARTEKGVAAKEHALGLKLYLETAEADRIRMMQSPDAPYTRTAAPKKTVELYEKLLPYAVVFGVEKQWSEEFKDIYTTPPDWYSGSNVHAFNSVYVASALSGSMGSAMTTAFSAPSSSSGSGFSGGGGGFSGGGGGGGGGGGW